MLLLTILVVLNPISGDIEKSELEREIADYCTSRGRRAVFFHTSGDDDQQKLRQKLAQEKPDAVFAAGGDGTVSLVAAALAGTGLPLGILPLGSGNGLSKDLHIPQELQPALKLIWEHEVQVIDTLEVNGHFSAHLADLGFNAVVVQRFAESDTRGPGAYVRIAMQEYLNYEPAVYRIETDQEKFEGPAFMLTVANANTFGSNVVINPDSRMDDGKFEICLIEPFPAAAAPGILYRLYTDSFDASVYTRRLRCQQATIWLPGQQHALVQLDGEPLELTVPIQIRISPRSLHVLTPPAQPE